MTEKWSFDDPDCLFHYPTPAFDSEKKARDFIDGYVRRFRLIVSQKTRGIAIGNKTLDQLVSLLEKFERLRVKKV